MISLASVSMAIEEASTLSECRSGLKEKLDDCFAPRNDPDPKKRFARKGITREIFEKSRLEHLLKLLHCDTINVPSHDAGIDAIRVAECIRGAQDSSSYCNVLATLLYSRCTDKTLRKFSSDLLERKAQNSISDSDLPLTKEDACKAFGTDDGYSFWEDQYIFSPVVLLENDESRYVGNKASCPLPILEEPEVIGQGAYAIVKKVMIERGHLVNGKDRTANDVGLAL